MISLVDHLVQLAMSPQITCITGTHKPCYVSTCRSTILEIITIMLLIETQCCPEHITWSSLPAMPPHSKMNTAKLLIIASTLQHTHGLVDDVLSTEQWKECGCWQVDWWLETLFCWKYLDRNILHTCTRVQIASLAYSLWMHLHTHQSIRVVSFWAAAF